MTMMMKKQWFALALAGLMLPAFGGKLIAHKGGEEEAKGNTLAAIQSASKHNFDFECDVWGPGMGAKTCYLSHDRVKDATKCAPIKDVLALVKQDMLVEIDAKGSLKLFPQIVDELKASGVLKRSRVVFATWSKDVSLKVKQELPMCSVWMGETGFRKDKSIIPPAEIAQRLKDAKADGISLRYDKKICTPAFFAEMKKLGVEVNVWTVDNLATVRQLLADGADWVTTNRPIEFSRALAK